MLVSWLCAVLRFGATTVRRTTTLGFRDLWAAMPLATFYQIHRLTINTLK